MKNRSSVIGTAVIAATTLALFAAATLLLHGGTTAHSAPVHLLMALSTGSLLLLTIQFLLYGFRQRKILAELEQSNQTLEAANQQLSASEQQLKASNQQMAASEQQLKAANQQMAAGEAALRLSEEKYRMILSFMPSCAAVYEAVDDGEDFIFRDFNRAAEKAEKTPRERLINKRVTDVFPGIKGMGLFKVFQEVWRSGLPVHFPVSVYKDDKLMGWRDNYVYKLPSGEVVAVYTDETERMQAQTLRDRLFNLSIDMVCVAGMDGYFKEINPAWQKTLGWPLETLLAKPWIEFVHPDDREATLSVKGTLDQGGLVFAFENRYQCRDGTFKTLSWNSLPVPEEKLLFSVVRDVTLLKKNQEELDKGQRLESLGLLAGGIAHDFNNLLGGLFGYLDLAMHEAAPGSGLHRKLERAMSAFDRAKGLTMQLLTFSKGGAPVKKVAALPPLVESAARLAVSGSNTDCHVEAAPELKACEVDEGQISQVVNNIVINARQAMPSGGLIRVTLADRVIHEKELPPLKAGEYVEISVADTGLGIPPENLGRIFDPFFTTKQMGSGLGLATSFSIIRKHGGHITAESRLGHGTVVRVLLPASSARLPVQKEAAAAPLPVKGRGRILLMDDEPIIIDMARDILESLGYRVETVRDGGQALESYRRALSAGSGFDAVILDLTVPGGMGGLEALAGLKRLDPGVRAVVSTGYSDSPAVADPAAHGFKAVAAKPYRLAELSRILEKVLGS